MTYGGGAARAMPTQKLFTIVPPAIDKPLFVCYIVLMNNRLNKYRDDLTYPEWLLEHKAALVELYHSFSEDEDFHDQSFQFFTMDLYINTKHPVNIIEGSK